MGKLLLGRYPSLQNLEQSMAGGMEDVKSKKGKARSSEEVDPGEY